MSCVPGGAEPAVVTLSLVVHYILALKLVHGMRLRIITFGFTGQVCLGGNILLEISTFQLVI